jgi:hypothetical protein
VALACEHSTFEYMSAHGSQFDEHLSKEARNPALGLPPDAGKGNSKVRRGQVSPSDGLLSIVRNSIVGREHGPKPGRTDSAAPMSCR